MDTLEGEWNTMLFNLLLQHRGGEHDEDETNELKEMFFNKLQHVRYKIKEAQPKVGKSLADAQQQFSTDCARKRTDQRPHTWHCTVSEYAEKSYMIINILNQTYEEQMGICIENVNQLTGDAHEVWSNLYEMVDTMGTDGVSSDEECMVDNKRVYHVKALPHHSTRVLSRVKFIDSQANHTNGYGNNASGTPPRTRIRPEEPQESNRKVPTGFTRLDGQRSYRILIMGTWRQRLIWIWSHSVKFSVLLEYLICSSGVVNVELECIFFMLQERNSPMVWNVKLCQMI